ncbi:MAG TPA: YbaK/EbsC family protein [Dehalococcoidia bacterium]|nr:YbaK/EbsC family protein [Dehalococcoidia bacterium]
MSDDAPSASAGANETPAELELQAAGVTYNLSPHVDGARTLVEFAARSGLRPSQVIKSLLLDVDGGRQAMLLLPGDREAYFTARSVRMADRDRVEAITGYRIGTVTPLALRTAGLPVLLEEASLAETLVSIGTGVAGRHIRLSPPDLVHALGAKTGAFSRRPANPQHT